MAFVFGKTTILEIHRKAARSLHSECAHPDYEYANVVSTLLKDSDSITHVKPFGIGWKLNVDRQNGFVSYGKSEVKYWRRLKTFPWVKNKVNNTIKVLFFGKKLITWI